MAAGVRPAPPPQTQCVVSWISHLLGCCLLTRDTDPLHCWPSRLCRRLQEPILYLLLSMASLLKRRRLQSTGRGAGRTSSAQMLTYPAIQGWKPQTPTQPILIPYHPSHFSPVSNQNLARCILIPHHLTLSPVTNSSLSAVGCPWDTSVFVLLDYIEHNESLNGLDE